MNWVNRSLFNKLMVIIVGGCLLILSAALTYFVQVERGLARYNSLIAEDLSYESQINLISVDFKTQVQEWKNVLLRGSNQAQLDRYWQSFENFERSIQRQGADLMALMPAGEERQLLESFLASHRQMGQEYRHGLREFINSGYNPTTGDQVVSGIDRRPTELLLEAADALTAGAVNNSRQIQQQVFSASVWSAALLLLAIFIFVGLALYIVNRAIVLPSRSLIYAVEKLSQGQLNVTIDSTRSDELGVLAKAARELQGFLAQIVAEMQQSSQRLAEASTQLEQTSGSIQDHAAQTNDSAIQVATAMEEMAAAASEVSNHAQDASQLASNANDAANDGLSLMQKAQESIDRLADKMVHSTSVVDELEQQAQSIGGVLEVIQAIAEQTNLLALNAAIEAARAGEHGRGFAVVADEVRTLAGRTQTSTGEIRQIIERVQLGARSTVDVMKESREISAESASAFSDTTIQLERINTLIHDISSFNAQVATAAEEQTSVSDDIARNIAHVSEQTHETLSSAHGLTDISDLLKRTVNSNAELVLRFQS